MIWLVFLVGQVSVTQYGAIPNDGIDDTMAFQQAFDRGGLVTVPTGEFHISSIVATTPVILQGSGGKQTANKNSHTSLVSHSPTPMIHRGSYIQNGVPVGPLTPGTGMAVSIRDIVMLNYHPLGSCVQLHNVSGPQYLHGSQFSSKNTGVTLSQVFDGIITNCVFTSTEAYDPNIMLEHARHKHGLYVSGHCSITGCSFTGKPVGLLVSGPQTEIKSIRVEMCKVGLWIDNRRYTVEHFGGGDRFFGTVASVSQESNEYGVIVSKGAEPIFTNLTVTNNIPGRGVFGLWLQKGSRARFDNTVVSGHYNGPSLRLDQQPFKHDDCWRVSNTTNQWTHSRPLQTFIESKYSAGHASFAKMPSTLPMSGPIGVEEPVEYTYATSIVVGPTETVVGGPAIGSVLALPDQMVEMKFHGQTITDIVQNGSRRVYKRRSDGMWLGYWEIPINQYRFVDDGKPFTGREFPLE